MHTFDFGGDGLLVAVAVGGPALADPPSGAGNAPPVAGCQGLDNAYLKQKDLETKDKSAVANKTVPTNHSCKSE